MEITAAVVHEKGGAFSSEALELDPPRDDELIVRITATGMCHTDLICRDQWSRVPVPGDRGHSGAGVVEEVGKGITKVQPGDHVVLTFLSCGACLNCQRGRPAYCRSLYELNFGGARPDGSTTLRTPDGQPVHGRFFGQSSFGTHALASERNTVKVPDDIPLEILGPLGCGVQTGAGTVLNSLQPGIGDSIAVFGAGAVGLSAVMAARVAACDPLIAVDLKPNRLELATALGASHTVNAAETDPVEAIAELTGGGANYTVDTTGSPAVGGGGPPPPRRQSMPSISACALASASAGSACSSSTGNSTSSW
jgi:aryl-alcohol dehydrogenase